MSVPAKPRVFILFHGRFPSEKAASIFLENEARAFRELGHETTVIAPYRFGRLEKGTYPFRVVYVPTIDLVPLHIVQSFAFRISIALYSWSAFVYLALNARRKDIIMSTEAFPLLVASYVFPRTLFELHDYPEKSFGMFRRLFRRVKHVLVTNQWKLDKFRADYPAQARKAFLEPNAVDVDMFLNAPDRAACRAKLGLPAGERLVVYTGHLYAWKGVQTLCEAGKALEAQVYVVGGTDADIAAYKAKYGIVPNLHIIGRRPHEEMPLWQRAADVLVLPNTAKEEISAHYTSPMKLFEYLASGTPIVASDIPSVRAIADETMAHLVAPDNPQALALGITNALASMKQNDAALTWVREHSWTKRALRIVETCSRAT